MSRNPYLIEGPALISFSGGRSSGYMLWHILDAHGGKLPDDVHVAFQNTGRERIETLDFIQECGERWSVPIAWLEYRYIEGKHTFERVSHNSASRNGEPFQALMKIRGGLPNPVQRYCTSELKVRVGKKFAQSIGWRHFTNIIGLRADEPRRVANIKKDNHDIWENYAPMAAAGATKREVSGFWSTQPFDLRLPNVNGTTPAGNCDLCFLKGGKTLLGLIRQNPELANWWAEAEAEAETRASKPSGARFRSDRPGHAEMARMVRDQGDLLTDLDDDTRPCGCHD